MLFIIVELVNLIAVVNTQDPQSTTLLNAMVTFSSHIIAEQSNLALNFITTSLLPKDGYLEIEFINETILTFNKEAQFCRFQGLDVQCDVESISQTKIQVYSFSEINLQGGTNLTIEIINVVKNPTQQSKAIDNIISIATMSPKDTLIDHCYILYTYIAEISDFLDFKLISRSNKQNGQRANYTFLVRFKTPQKEQSLLIFTLEQPQLIAPVQCSSSDSILVEKLKCEQSVSGEIVITLECQKNQFCPKDMIPKLTTVYISINDILNPPSPAPGKPIELRSEFNGTIQSKFMKKDVMVNDNIPGIISGVVISNQNGFILEPDNYTFTFQTMNAMTEQSAIVIELPANTPITVLRCYQGGIGNNRQSISCKRNLNLIAFQPIVDVLLNKNTLQLTVEDLTNTNKTKGIFRISHYKKYAEELKDQLYLIDQSEKITFDITKCQLPCRTCANDNPKQCLTCYSSNILSRNIWVIEGGQCRETCPIGYFEDSDSKCQPCSTDCLTCVIEKQCTSCNPRHRNGLRYLQRRQCVSFCGMGSTQVKNVCYSCPWRCESCSSPEQCVRCESRFYLDGNKCSRCPGECESCSTYDTCSSCHQNYYLTDLNQCEFCTIENCVACLSETDCRACQFGYFVSIDGCQKCPNECASCYDQDTCAGCNPGQYLEDYKCNVCPTSCSLCDNKGCTQCDRGSYLNNRQCEPCSYGCELCSKKECKLCSSGFYLDGQTKCQPI